MAASCVAFTIRGRPRAADQELPAQPRRGYGAGWRHLSRWAKAEAEASRVAGHRFWRSVLDCDRDFRGQNTTPVGSRFSRFGLRQWRLGTGADLGAFGGGDAAAGISRESQLRWRQRRFPKQLKAAQTRVAQLEAAQPADTTALSTTFLLRAKDQRLAFSKAFNKAF